VIALGYLLRVRVREDESTELAVPAREPAPEAPAHVVVGATFEELLGGVGSDGDVPTMVVPVVSPSASAPPDTPPVDDAAASRRGRRRRSR
jgi:hypothetical protein